MNRTVLTLVLCVLTVLAGCGAGPSNDGSSGAATTDGSGAGAGTEVADTTGTDGGSATATTGGETTQSGTGGQSGESLDGATYTRFVTALESAGSFTATERMTLRTDDTGASFAEATFETVSRVDVAGDRGFAETTSEVAGASDEFGSVSSASERYTDGATTYQREVVSMGDFSQTQYDVSVTGAGTIQPVSLESLVGSPDDGANESSEEFGQVQFTRVGTETYDGVQVTRYEASGPAVTDIVNAGLDDGSDASFSSAAAAVLVDGEGVIRSQSFSFTFEQDGVTYDAELERVVGDLGSTTVAEPDWLAEATARSGQ
ncbi:hypothetical protein ACFPYI_05575 [Halomarina salina]|uniref:Uncharacterized protein n=1 Tax=Halomarina salina TaxID=1872699 RepID=A0ABD5RKG1_9EURY|nr:hypothetical protein [Halomarina salina]